MTFETQHEILRLYYKKVDLREIAEKTQTSHQSIKTLLHKDLKIKRKGKSMEELTRPYLHLSREKINKIIVLSNFGYTLDEIANDQGINSYIIERIIQDHDRFGNRKGSDNHAEQGELS